MSRLVDITNAMANTLASIPALVAALAPVNPIQPYIDLTPQRASTDQAIYQMQPGQLLVLWRESVMTTGAMTRYSHTVHICVRALQGGSDLDLIDLIMTGVPEPGDGLPWLRCPILPFAMPTEVPRIGRDTDTEGIDYGLIVTETAEVADWPLPGSYTLGGTHGNANH
jgi:hypothetical protein